MAGFPPPIDIARERFRRFRHPDEDALHIHIPHISDDLDGERALPVSLRLRGRRIPVRAYVREIPVPARADAGEGTRALRRVRHVLAYLIVRAHARERLAATAVFSGRLVRRGLRRGAGAAVVARDRVSGAELARHEAASGRRMHRQRAWALVFAAGAFMDGLLLMYYCDRVSGRRRRALARDRIAHLKNVASRRLPHRAERKARFMRGRARGIGHNAAGVMLHGDGEAIDDETLVARVRSEVLRGQWVHAGEIHVDACRGEVTLRGQLEHEDAIRRLIEDAGHVDGVGRVRSYLHLPGTLAPNKAEIFEMERAPYPARG